MWSNFFTAPQDEETEEIVPETPAVEEKPQITEDDLFKGFERKPVEAEAAEEEAFTAPAEENAEEAAAFAAPAAAAAAAAAAAFAAPKEEAEEAPAVEEPIVEEEDLVITQPESSEEMFDPEKELELFRRKVEQEMGITLEEIEEEERTEYVETVFAEPAPGIVAYEEPEAEASEEPMTLEDLFGEEAAAAEAPAEEPAPAAETAEPAPEAPAKEAKPTAEEDLFKFKPAEAAGVAAAGAAAAAEQTIEQRIAEDTKNPPKDDRITYHDVFAEEIAAEKKGADKAPKKHTGLKVLAVILCILIIAEIVIICIKYMAPDSAAAIQLQDIFNSIYGALSSMMGKLGN